MTVALIFLSGLLFAQETEVSYLEGFPELRAATGDTFELDFGDLIEQGDSVVTGRSDYVELAQGEGTTIRVEPDTVFTLREVDEGGERRSVMTSAVGSVSYRFNRLTGREPRVGSAAVVAGIRGTELTVYAGSDGSTLFLVDSGLVEVTSAGQTVSLAEAQGVEVGAGQPPGEVFELPDAPVDYADWNGAKKNEFLSDPVTALSLVAEQLLQYSQTLDELEPIREQTMADFQEARDQLQKLREEGKEDEAETFDSEVYEPLQAKTAGVLLNLRYNALSALSLRRYAVGNMYLEMKTRYIFDKENPEYTRFLELYDQIVERFDREVTEYLGSSDI